MLLILLVIEPLRSTRGGMTPIYLIFIKDYKGLTCPPIETLRLYLLTMLFLLNITGLFSKEFRIEVENRSRKQKSLGSAEKVAATHKNR